MKILMTGATGWIGRTLGIELVRRGHTIVGLVRDPAKAKANCPFPAEWIHWPSAAAPIDFRAMEGVDAVLNLMGEPVAGPRWNDEIKDQILQSRIDSTRALAAMVRERQIPVFISASAIGYYGDRGDEELTEQSSVGSGFLANVCARWEQELFAVKDVSRCVAVRIGIVLGREGGALAKMVPAFQYGLGGRLGTGQQWMSWIHLSDLQRLIIKAIENESYRGAINGTAPHPVRQREFAHTLGSVLNRPSVVPVPAPSLRLMMGEMAGVVLASQKVMPKNALAAGFKFEYPDLPSALNSILAPERAGESEILVQQFVAHPIEKVFPFYSNEMNLEKITPPFLNFKVLGKSMPEIRENTIIDYRLSLHGIPFKWRTKILEWSPPHRFVDIQLKGPYRLWHHTHQFESLGSGTLISDQVRYKVPLGFLGDALVGWKVKRDVKAIFDYRQKVIASEIWP